MYLLTRSFFDACFSFLMKSIKTTCHNTFLLLAWFSSSSFYLLRRSITSTPLWYGQICLLYFKNYLLFQKTDACLPASPVLLVFLTGFETFSKSDFEVPDNSTTSALGEFVESPPFSHQYRLDSPRYFDHLSPGSTDVSTSKI